MTDTEQNVFDAHMHLGEFPMFNVATDVEGLLATMDECGISGGAVFHPDNNYVAEALESTDRLVGLVWVNPRLPDYLPEVERLLDGERFVGVKLHPLLDGYHPDDPTVHPIIELLIERSFPVLIHCGHPIFTLPWSIEELIVRYPEAKVILGHMGHGNIVYINASIDIAERNPNVYLETSGMPMHTKIREAVERVGVHRVMYGSDAPFHHPSVELEKVRVSGLDPDQLAHVLGRNARRLYLNEAEMPTKQVEISSE